MKFQIFPTFSTPIIALPHPLKFHLFFLLWTVPKGALPSHFLANSTVHAPRHRRSALRLFGSYRCAVLPGLHGGVGRLGKSPLPTRPPWLGIVWQETITFPEPVEGNIAKKHLLKYKSGFLGQSPKPCREREGFKGRENPRFGVGGFPSP